MAKGIIRKIPNVMYIFCEGEKTEPLYIEAYIADNANAKSKVIRIPKTKKNTPEQLVDMAIKKKNSDATAEGDVFWVVYDREDVQQHSHALHKRAWDKAMHNGVNVALSNVCFEFWLLLHFGYTNAAFTSYSNLISHSDFLKNLKKINIDSYNKGSKLIYPSIKYGLVNARKNATTLNSYIKSLHPNNIGAPYLCGSYTGFNNLLDAIDSF
ncbi:MULTISPECIES: RloB family protein [Pectobacterium]|uniref:RloB family protein n=1 Tax=Pectobacterium TaxID=122277 RepID=UPI000E24ED0C|nr:MULTISPECIES: RloB family protein [Pectobacterium]MCL6387414.1 RloB domain-containing protein [Pectobacterium carotovorum subsp. carotovorum]RRO03494.1 RloB domain-containing protein [Pectobacterium aquaticum]